MMFKDNVITALSRDGAVFCTLYAFSKRNGSALGFGSPLKRRS